MHSTIGDHAFPKAAARVWNRLWNSLTLLVVMSSLSLFLNVLNVFVDAPYVDFDSLIVGAKASHIRDQFMKASRKKCVRIAV